ncbi:MAG: hypothetical protein ACERKN_00625 [Velocimicrobium sp.]
MKFNWKKLLWIDKRLPKTSYILRTFVGAYLIYIVYQIISGMSEPNVTHPMLVIISTIIFSVFCVFCLLSGILGLYYKEYRGEGEEDNTNLKEDETNEENKE